MKTTETFYLEETQPDDDFTLGKGWYIMAEGVRPPTSANPGKYTRKAGWFETKTQAQQRLLDLRADGYTTR